MSRNRSNSDPLVTNTTIKTNTKPKVRQNRRSPLKKNKFCGISNQGATCYLNSLLQCLYMTPEFKNALFEWQYRPRSSVFADQHEKKQTDNSNVKVKDQQSHTDYELPITIAHMRYSAQDELEMSEPSFKFDPPPEHCIPFQLQLLFARLECSCRSAASTKSLTKSFHWDARDSFQQHDVQELLRVLLEAVSRCLLKIGKPDLLNNLFKGTLIDYLHCKACNTERRREDIFLDLSLPIGGGVDSLQKSLDLFVTPELMQGQNQVLCHECNCKQDFQKGLKFQTLPKLLIIQLKRFMFDWQHNRRIKVGHRVTFPKQLDMSKYLPSTAATAATTEITEIAESDNKEKKSQFIYYLYGVIIHSGGALGGHYYAYIYNNEDKNWFNFNDSCVTPITDEQFETCYGGDKIRGTAYVLLYKQVKFNDSVNTVKEVPKYLMEIVNAEDEEIKKRWEQWQKEMRTITIKVHCESNDEMMEIKIDVEEFTYQSLHVYVCSLFNIEFIDGDDDNGHNARLRRLYPNCDGFLGESYADEKSLNLKVSNSNSNWPKLGLHLMLEIRKNDDKFVQVNPNIIWLRLFVITEENRQMVVENGFINKHTFSKAKAKADELSVDDAIRSSISLCSVSEIVQLKHIILEHLQSFPKIQHWRQINLLRFSYSNCTVLSEQNTLQFYKIKMGDLIFIEQTETEVHAQEQNNNMNQGGQEREQPDQTILLSKTAQLYIEQKLKITVHFNRPCGMRSQNARLLELLTSMIDTKSSKSKYKATQKASPRIEFNHSIRINKQSTIKELKLAISKKLSLQVSQFRLRKSALSKEFKDLEATLQSSAIFDGGFIYVENGVPTKSDQIRIQFSLYDPSFSFTDPVKKKRKLAQNLFEAPFPKNTKIREMKKGVTLIINKLFPLFREKYTFANAIKILQREMHYHVALDLKLERDNGQEQEQKLPVPEIDISDIKIANTSTTNIFDINHVRIRKQRGGTVGSMLLDNLELNKNVTARDDLKLVIEKCAVEECFTKNHICFFLRRFRADQGGINGKLYKPRELIISKKQKVIDLKLLIAKLCLSKVELENISIVKGFSSTPMNASSVQRLQWLQKSVLSQSQFEFEFDAQNSLNSKETQNQSENENENKMEEIDINAGLLEYTEYSSKMLESIRVAISVFDDEPIGSSKGFHLRNGDVVVWQDVMMLPNKEKAEAQKTKRIEARKKLKRNPNFSGTNKIYSKKNKFQRVEASLKIRTYDEFLVDEAKQQAQQTIETAVTDETEKKKPNPKLILSKRKVKNQNKVNHRNSI